MSTLENRCDVVISGGGLIGLSLGIALGDAGLKTIVIDREHPTETQKATFDGRVSAIAWTSSKALAALGIWRHVNDAQPIWDIRVTDKDSPLFLHYDHRDLGTDPFGYLVENRALRKALHVRASEIPDLKICAPSKITALERRENGVEVMTDDGTRFSAPLIVGADGRQSFVRTAVGIKTVAWAYPQIGIVCTVTHEHPHHGIAQERFLPAGPFAILPMTGNRVSLVWTEREDRAPALLALPTPSFLAELSSRFGDYLGKLELNGPRWSYPLALHHAQSYIAPRVALIGDAAHGIHPIAGQGLNLGLRDVAALAEVLVETKRLGLDIGNPLYLETYQRWRRFDTVLLSAVTDGLNRLFSNDIAPIRILRDLGLGVVNRADSLKRAFMLHARGDSGRLPKLLRGEAI